MTYYDPVRLEVTCKIIKIRKTYFSLNYAITSEEEIVAMNTFHEFN